MKGEIQIELFRIICLLRNLYPEVEDSGNKKTTNINLLKLALYCWYLFLLFFKFFKAK